VIVERPSPCYRIERLDDILKVPADLRPALFRDLETALLTHELVYGELAQQVGIGSLLWSDDGSSDVTMQTPDGQTLFELHVHEGEEKPPEGGSRGA
jgi:hypothetical protein